MGTSLQSGGQLRACRHHAGGHREGRQHPPQEQNSTWQRKFSKGENLTMSGSRLWLYTHWLVVQDSEVVWSCTGQTSKCSNWS